MEQVLTEEGEKTFYYMARNSTQPLHIPSPHVRLGLLYPVSVPGREGRGGGEVAGVMPDDLLCVYRRIERRGVSGAAGLQG
eukprot:COSAG01_NODE_1031_length_12014_cov_27.936131_8_plen_81_part_00